MRTGLRYALRMAVAPLVAYWLVAAECLFTWFAIDFMIGVRLQGRSSNTRGIGVVQVFNGADYYGRHQAFLALAQVRPAGSPVGLRHERRRSGLLEVALGPDPVAQCSSSRVLSELVRQAARTAIRG